MTASLDPVNAPAGVRRGTVGNSRNNLIDAFRGVAIVMVVLFHYAIIGFKWEPQAAFRLGKLGVEVFFVISGLVITMTALGASDAVDFGLRRFARIYPTFVAAATLTFLIGLFYDPAEQSVELVDYIYTLTFLSERLGHKFVDGAYWSLLVEVQFYIVVTISLLLLRRRFWIAVLVALVVGAAIRPWNKAIAALLFSSYSSFFLIGMATWYAVAERSLKASGLLFLGAIFTFVVGPQSFIQWPALIPAAIFSTLFINRVNTSFGPLAWVGRISYPLYLIHQVLGISLITGLRTLGVADWESFILVSGLALGTATAFHYWLEVPAQIAILAFWKKWRRPTSTNPAGKDR